MSPSSSTMAQGVSRRVIGQIHHQQAEKILMINGVTSCALKIILSLRANGMLTLRQGEFDIRTYHRQSESLQSKALHQRNAYARREGSS
jgi:hypothetical protein